MFQFTRLASSSLWIQEWMTGSSPAGFPHSGTTGSQPACGSPMLFAAYRALPRLSVPRHPPCALVRLTGFCFDAPAFRRIRAQQFLTDLVSSVLLPSPRPKLSKMTTCVADVRMEREAFGL